MTSRWSSLRANRPYQQAGMSVEVYYHQFCDWKDEIDREGHQCSEASLIDDFIIRMTWDLLVRMYGYPSPPFSLSEAFKRAQFEESIISLEELTRQIGTDKVFEEMSHPISIDTAETQGAEGIPDKDDDFVIGVPSLADHDFQSHLKSNELHLNTLDPWSESENENENKHLIVEEYEQNEGNNDNEGDVLSFGEMLSVLVLENEATVNSSAIGLLEAWVKGVIRSMEVVWNQNVMWNDAHKVFDEMTPTSRAAVMNEQVMDPYISGINSNKLTLFDPGGGRNCVVSLSGGVVHPLITEAQETFVDGLKGVVSSLSHPLSIVAAKDGHCLIVSDHSHIFSVGSHAIFSLIVDSTVHGDDFTDIGLKASYEEANSELCMKIRSFYSGGCCLPHIGCDFSDFFNRDQVDCCWITIMADVGVKAVLQEIWIIIAFFCGVIFRFDCAFFQNGPDIFVELGTWQMNYHVHDLIVNYSLAIKAITETSELLCKRDVDGSSCVELLTALCGYTLHNGRSKELCDEEFQWQCGDQFRTKREDMVTLLSSVYHNISSSPVCSGMNGNGHDSITIQQLIAQTAGSMDMIQVWEVLVFNSTFDYLPSFHVTFSFNIWSGSKTDITDSHALRSRKAIRYVAFMYVYIWKITGVMKTIVNQKPFSFSFAYLSFPAFPCEFVSVDIGDVLGINQLDLAKTVRKFPIYVNLKLTGLKVLQSQPLSKEVKHDDSDNRYELYYRHHDTDSLVNTMEDLDASLFGGDQLLALNENATEGKKWSAPKTEGCRVAGFERVTKVQGKLIILACSVTHSFDTSQMNMSHVVTWLNFGRGADHMISFGNNVMGNESRNEFYLAIKPFSTDENEKEEVDYSTHESVSREQISLDQRECKNAIPLSYDDVRLSFDPRGNFNPLNTYRLNNLDRVREHNKDISKCLVVRLKLNHHSFQRSLSVQPTGVPLWVEVTRYSVIKFYETALPTYQYYGNVGDSLVAAEEIGFLTFEACDLEHASLIVKKVVKVKVIADATLVMDWCIKIVDELATETIMIAGDDWKLQMEQGWSSLQKVVCNEDALLGWVLYDDDGLKILEYYSVATMTLALATHLENIVWDLGLYMPRYFFHP